MSRWRKFFLLLVGTVLFALGLLPWWLGFVLRPVLHAQNITFGRYERLGYASFKLHNAQYTRPGLVITAGEVQSDTPLLWLWQRLRGVAPLVAVDHWLLRHQPAPDTAPTQNRITGLADLQRLLVRLVPILQHWLPHVNLGAGKLRGITPEMTLAKAEWINSTLRVEGFSLFGRELTVEIAPAKENSFAVTARIPEHDARLQFMWSATEITGGGTWWNQPLQLTARYAAHGWLPAEASGAADHWQVPATRLKLGTPYALVKGNVRGTWQDGIFDLSLEAAAEPVAGTSAPPFEAQAAAHGNLHELTLTELRVNAPFATANLTAPVTFSVDHPLSRSAAELSIKVDLAKQPWIDARGRAEGSVTVTSTTSGAKHAFHLEFNDVSLQNCALEKARAEGSLEWPILKLEKFEAQLDKTSFVRAHGVVNWQTRELNESALQAKVGPAWFARWLPQNTDWTSAEITMRATGPLDAPHHEGSLKISQAQWKPLQPVDLDAAWQGTGAKLEISFARAVAATSTIELAGNLDSDGLQLTALSFSPHRQIAWQLTAPTHLTWAPPWQLSALQLAGPAGQFNLKAQGGADGFVEVTATAFDSAWLQDWITVAGPRWQIHSLHASGRIVHDALAFDTTLTAQIEMQPTPAEVKLIASGDADGVRLKELTVVESNRVLTRASGVLPLSWKIRPTAQLVLDESGPLELSASSDPDSPLWSALAAYTKLNLIRPEAKIDLKGTLREPLGELQLNAALVEVREGRFKFTMPALANLTLAGKLSRNSVNITTLTTQLDGQALQASGQIPMSDRQWEQLWKNPAAFDWNEASAQLEIPGADLGALGGHLPDFLAPKGRLRAKVELAAGGKFSGDVHLTDAASRPLPPFSTLQEINADLTLADHKLSIQTFTAKLGGEPVAVDGSLTIEPGKPLRLALGLKGKNLPLVRNTGLLVRNDVDLHADTNESGVTRVSGTVTLRDCLVLANLGALLPTGQRGVTRQPPYFAVAAEPLQSWPLAVEVRGEQAVRVRTTVFNGTASAHFQVGGTLGEPRAVGELTVNQGQVLFPFATFAVQQGTVRLREADPFHAVVNLNATSQRRDFQLRLEVTGELPSPNVVLTSTPALEAQEVLLMVMTGQPPRTEATATTSSSAQRLALLGAYLGRGVFQDLGIGGEDRLEISAGERISTQGRETYEFDYKLDPRWSLTGEYDRFDGYNAGLKWHLYTEESKPLEKK